MSEENNQSGVENPSQTPQDNGGEGAQVTPAASTGEGESGGVGHEPSLLEGAKTVDEPKEGNDQKAEDKSKEVPEGAPEAYENFTAPEGMEFDSGVIDAFKGVAKELNLPQAKAQEFLDKMAPVIAERQVERINAISKEWAEKSRSDKEIGGDNHVRAMADVARLRDRFAMNDDGKLDPDIAEFMSSPMGNHPGCLKLLARAGRAFGEAGFPRSSAGDGRIRPEDIYDVKV